MEKKIEEAAYKFLRRRIISKGGYWDEEAKDVVGETISGRDNVMRTINYEQPRLIEFAKSSEVKEYWQEELYSEKEVLSIMASYLEAVNEWVQGRVKREQNPYPKLLIWFEQNKKK